MILRYVFGGFLAILADRVAKTAFHSSKKIVVLYNVSEIGELVKIHVTSDNSVHGRYLYGTKQHVSLDMYVWKDPMGPRYLCQALYEIVQFKGTPSTRLC